MRAARRLGLKVLVATAAASAVLWFLQRRVEPQPGPSDRVAASAVASMVAPSQFAMAKAKAELWQPAAAEPPLVAAATPPSPPQPSPPPPEAGSLRRPIPHRLHQSWKTAAIPKVWAPFIRSWVDLHPGWSYTLYSDDALRRFFVAELPEFLAAFDACDPICKADFSRLGFMYVFGGVYADMDFEALRPFDALVDPPESPEGGGVANELLLAKEPELHARLLEGKASFVCNALLASRPAHPFWRYALEGCAERIRGGNVGWGAAGPWAIARLWAKAGEDVRRGATVLPEEYFYPQVALWNLPKMIAECEPGPLAEHPENAEACAQLEPDYGASPAVREQVMSLVRQKQQAQGALKAAGGEDAALQGQVDKLRTAAADAAMSAAAATAEGERGGGHFTAHTFAQHRWHCSWCKGVDEEATVPITELVPSHMLTVY